MCQTHSHALKLLWNLAGRALHVYVQGRALQVCRQRLAVQRKWPLQEIWESMQPKSAMPSAYL